jgi:hypothetical protein
LAAFGSGKSVRGTVFSALAGATSEQSKQAGASGVSCK